MNTPEEFGLLAARLKAVADAERLQIVAALFDGPKCVGELTKILNDKIVKVSHHLGVLRHSHIVTTTKQGRFIEYALHPDLHVVGADGKSERSIDLGGCRLKFVPADGSPHPLIVNAND